MQSMDEVDPRSLFEQRASVMKAVPRFMRGPFRNALKLVLREVTRSHNEVDQERGWKLFFMLPRMHLHKNLEVAASREPSCWRGLRHFPVKSGIQLVAASELCDEKAARARRRGAWRFQDTIESRTMRAEMLVQLGELSSARQALEGASLAPGDNATLTALTNEAKRPSRPREPLPREVVEHVAGPAFLSRSFQECNEVGSRRGVGQRSGGPTRERVLMMLPRMLLHRPPGGGHISRNKLTSRFEAFSRGEWFNLIEASIACDERAAQSRRRGGVETTLSSVPFVRRHSCKLASCLMPGKCWREPILPQGTKPRWMLSEMRSVDLRNPPNLCQQS